jgi:hypothetical protein
MRRIAAAAVHAAFASAAILSAMAPAATALGFLQGMRGTPDAYGAKAYGEPRKDVPISPFEGYPG